MHSSTFELNDTIDDDKKSPSLSQNASLQCNVSPLVIMSILNHYQRRPSNKPHKQRNNAPKGLYPSFVIGLLFGHKDNQTNALIVNDAFGLETQLDPESKAVAVKLDNAKKAVILHSIAHPNDRLVGWYRTGLTVDLQSIPIHNTIILKNLQALSNQRSKNAGPELDESEYVHLCVDTQLKNDKFSIKAFTIYAMNDPLQELEYQNYLKEKKRRERLAKNQKTQTSKSAKSRKRRRGKVVSTPTAKSQTDGGAGDDAKNKEKESDNKDAATSTEQSSQPQQAQQVELEPLEEVEKPMPVFHRFKEVPTMYHAAEPERIGLDMIIESPPEGTALDSPSTLMSDTNHLENVLQLLLENLEQVESYVVQVLTGNAEGDESLGWLIGDALSSVPNLSPQKFEQIISDRLQDFLMMVYLGKMTKAQLMVADKINKVLPSTVPGFADNK